MSEHLYVHLDGGVNYSPPYCANAWRAKSLAGARRFWEDLRDANGQRLMHDFVNGGKVYYPCWGDGFYPGDYVASAWYLDDDHPAVTQRDVLPWLADVTDLHPDRVLRIGPRGGLRWERA